MGATHVASCTRRSVHHHPDPLSCRKQPVRRAQVPGDAPQAAEVLDAGQALLPWVTDLQRGVAELRGVLANIDARQLQLDVRSAGRRT